MSEKRKTLIALAIALGATVIAASTRPKQGMFQADAYTALVGEDLVDFDDPSKAASLEIVRVDSDTGDLQQFKVARNVEGSWSLPSHANYPADAEAQVRDVSTLFIDKTILGVAASTADQHATFGVREPNADNVGEDGVGILVRMEDRSGEELLSLIVGKPDKKDPSQRFVRKVGQDYVLVAKIDTKPLSTEFEQWIDKDVLQLNVFDIQDVKIRDYTIVQTDAGPRLVNRSTVDLSWNAVRGEWTPQRMVTFDQAGREVDAGMQEDEELNLANLNALKDAIAELSIVDVRPKPAGMGSGLTMSEAARTQLEKSLNQMGFRTPPASLAGGYKLLADNGEVIITMNDGVRYVLKFGTTVAKTISELQQQNRVLLVTAELDESKAPLPPEPKYPEAKEGDDVDAIAAEREKMRREYQRLLDARDESLAGAKRRVLELNDRFADWYYVVSDKQFQQIMLNRAEVVKPKTASGAPATGTSPAEDATPPAEDTSSAKE